MTPPPGGPRTRHTGLVIGAILAVLVVIAAAVGFIVVTRDGGDDIAQKPGEIFLDPATSAGQHPFGSLTGTAVSVTTTTRASSSTSTTTSTTPGTTTMATVSGGERGLYGGSLNSRVCDPEGQIRFLQDNRSVATAFVQALNGDPSLKWSGGTQVSVDQLPEYIRSLTSVTLMNDTRVTNYGYRNGRATALQSILQAGTAVMVDTYGVPRVKCNCGNPLTPPVPVTTTPTYTGPQWPTFDPTSVVVVNQTNVTIDVFVLQNVNGTGTIERTPGSDGTDTDLPPITAPNGQVLGTGDVQATLTWTGTCDLDLHVLDPSGTEIHYNNPTSPTGGQLDVDDQGDGGGTHVENVFWPTGRAPRGVYSVFVQNYTSNGGGSCPYNLVVSADGRRVGTGSGSLAEDQRSNAVTFTY